MKIVNRILKFLRLSDQEGDLSLTNISVMVLLVKIALVPDFSINEAALFLTALGGYNLKKYFKQTEPKAIVQPTTSDVRLQKIEDALTKLQVKSGFTIRG